MNFAAFIQQRIRQVYRRQWTAPLPSRTAPLIGAVLAEQHDEWIEGRRYLGLEVLTRSRAVLTGSDPADTKPRRHRHSPPDRRVIRESPCPQDSMRKTG